MYSKGAKALMDEIRKTHAKTMQQDAPQQESNVERKKSTADSNDAPPPSEEKTPRKRRMRRCLSADPELSNVMNSQMFTVSIVGGLSLPDYPLNKGERLAIAKLTPISVAT